MTSSRPRNPARLIPSPQRGFALLIVLWTLVLITLLVTHLNAAGRSETQIAGNLRSSARLEAAADGAVHAAIFHLLDRTLQSWRPDGTPHGLKLGTDAAQVRITDEAAKINPSNATPELLRALLQAVGIDAAQASTLSTAIVLWRTPFGNTNGSNPRFDAYRTAGRAYGPSGGPFGSMDELGAVIGMTPDILARLVPHLTLYTDADPDTAQADPVVRKALAAANGGIMPIVATLDAAIRVVAVQAKVAGDGGHFTRRAIIRILNGGPRPDYRILLWQAPADD